ncbi:MAG: pantoate--beta-alanine ligase [Armatimonadetes bacterium]|nr:pantoate--beta-alanine ligase [Armatimonadota bacterium]
MVICDPQIMRELSREWLREGKTIGLVPTMGNLHEGHLSLMRRAASENDIAVASIFVNPKQFGPNEDFAAYPRTFEADLAGCRSAGLEIVFAPTGSAMYPTGFCTRVEVDELTSGLCGAARPGHFSGVTTVVARLHCLILPTRAYYGEKDYQQLQVISRMTEDLGLGIEVIGMPIVRESDGLAMSSRNQYLDADERQAALCLSRALRAAQEAAAGGPVSAAAIEDAAADVIADEPLAKIDYVSLVDPRSLVPMAYLDEPGRLCLAARVGPARLIDNALIVPGGSLAS